VRTSVRYSRVRAEVGDNIGEWKVTKTMRRDTTFSTPAFFTHLIQRHQTYKLLANNNLENKVDVIASMAKNSGIDHFISQKNNENNCVFYR